MAADLTFLQKLRHDLGFSGESKATWLPPRP